jgi:nucleotide-binding universal stress UspA family protein
MFKHILVPLDGSSLAEAALQPAASLAQTLKAPVTLLHIIEKNAPEEVHKDRHLTQAQDANAYLEEIARQRFPKGSRVEWHVHEAEVKDVAASIVQHAEELKPDLIIMCAHGRGGVRDIIFGSIAQQVLAQGITPVLLLQPKSTGQPPPFQLQRMLIPLDSESMHDDSLPIAEYLARSYKAELHLLCVIPTLGTLSGEQAAAGSLLPGTASAFLDIKEENAKGHLQSHLAELIERGFKASAEVSRGDPAQGIVTTAARIHVDLIVLSTHRRAGMDAFWARSVAPNVARHTTIPILLLPLTVRGS